MARAQRWRGVGVEHRGYRIARVEDRSNGEVVGVYRRLGRWRMYRNDDPVKDAALASCARRVLVGHVKESEPNAQG